MATHLSQTSLEPEIKTARGGRFAAAPAPQAPSAPPPTDRSRHPLGQAVRKERAALGRQGTLAVVLAAFTMVTGSLAALHFAGKAKDIATAVEQEGLAAASVAPAALVPEIAAPPSIAPTPAAPASIRSAPMQDRSRRAGSHR